MGFFDRFRKKEEQVVIDNGNRDMYGFENIERQDGSVLKIKALVDKEGKQQYQTVVDQRTGEQISLPQYVIMRINEQNEFRQDVVSMELVAEALQHPQYSNWIANDMLSEQNIDRVLNEQYGYVGGVQTRNGQIVRTVYRPGIVETLEQQKEAEKTEELLEDIRGGMDKERYKMYMQSQNYEVNVKTSHAQVLNPEMNPHNRKCGYDIGGR